MGYPAAGMGRSAATVGAMKTTIRQARPSDLAAIHELLRATGLYTSSVTLQGDATYLLAERGRVLVAALGLEHGQDAALLRSFAVHPDEQGRGLSRTLLSRAYALLRRRGSARVYLFSADGGEYWVHMGYRRVNGEEVAAFLPDTPQIRSALHGDWLLRARSWRLDLPPGEAAPALRAARPDDFGALADFLRGGGLGVEGLQPGALGGGGLSLVLAHDTAGELVGSAGLEHGQGAALLRSVLVREDYRGSGLLGELLRWADAEARARGHTRLYLFNNKIPAFWWAQGYAPVPAQVVADALPGSPQVHDALERNWLHLELGWVREL